MGIIKNILLEMMLKEPQIIGATLAILCAVLTWMFQDTEKEMISYIHIHTQGLQKVGNLIQSQDGENYIKFYIFA